MDVTQMSTLDYIALTGDITVDESEQLKENNKASTFDSVESISDELLNEYNNYGK